MNQPLAYVHPQAKVAKNVVIEPFVNIEKNVEIGEGTWIGSNVTIMEGARIGKNCKIFPGAVVSAIPQDLKFNGEETIVKIGDNTTVREFVTINRGTKASYETIVGNNCLLMAYVHIAHDCIVGNNVILTNAATLAGHITIDDYAIVGGLSAVHQFCKIGAHTMISGGSLVRKDVPPYTKAAREPLSYVGIN
ncbi:MAG: acyl-[acyl-carrier-protein]--UDP-N-acetylglucosamine O-acyltransferase, partial [Bacteroidetes bacterium HGW-Bacteroidetes-22]